MTIRAYDYDGLAHLLRLNGGSDRRGRAAIDHHVVLGGNGLKAHCGSKL